MQASLSDYQLCFVFQLKGRWAGVGLELEEHEWMGGGGDWAMSMYLNRPTILRVFYETRSFTAKCKSSLRKESMFDRADILWAFKNF